MTSEENNGKTGFVLLADDDGKVLGKITKEHKADDIARMIKEKAAEL